jgi:hypothetical protein
MTSTDRHPSASLFQGKRVLLLLQGGDGGDCYRRELRHSGAFVLGPIASSLDALTLVYEERPDGAILDARLDAQTSFAVAEFLWRARVPFVLVTFGRAVEMPPEFQSRLLVKGIPVALIADQLFGSSTPTSVIRHGIKVY